MSSTETNHVRRRRHLGGCNPGFNIKYREKTPERDPVLRSPKLDGKTNRVCPSDQQMVCLDPRQEWEPPVTEVNDGPTDRPID